MRDGHVDSGSAGGAVIKGGGGGRDWQQSHVPQNLDEVVLPHAHEVESLFSPLELQLLPQAFLIAVLDRVKTETAMPILGDIVELGLRWVVRNEGLEVAERPRQRSRQTARCHTRLLCLLDLLLSVRCRLPPRLLLCP
jgi:hypothetical protein